MNDRTLSGGCGLRMALRGAWSAWSRSKAWLTPMPAIPADEESAFWRSPGSDHPNQRFRPERPLTRTPGRDIDWRRELGGLVAGKTFAEVGGLWNTVNERVSLALAAGCREATMIDIQPLENTLWTRFHDRCRELGVSGYRSVCGDICDDRIVAEGPFDVVHCAGVIYHCPNPLVAIRNLITITRERVMVSSVAIPERIANRAGTFHTPAGCCLFVPALGDHQRAILRGTPDLALHLALDFSSGRDERGVLSADGRFRYGPWWWLYTAETFVRMVASFDNVRIEKTWERPHRVTVLARRLEGRWDGNS